MVSTTPPLTLVTAAVVVPVVAVVRDVVDVAAVRAVAVVAVDVARVVAVPPAVPAPSSAAVPVAVLSTPRTSLLSRPSAPKLLGPSELHHHVDVSCCQQAANALYAIRVEKETNEPG